MVIKFFTLKSDSKNGHQKFSNFLLPKIFELFLKVVDLKNYYILKTKCNIDKHVESSQTIVVIIYLLTD